jgi:hypothetical protein
LRVDAPDYIAPVVGWRVWRVTENGDNFRLRSVLYPSLWIPGEAMIGSCAPGRPGCALRHSAPALECSCGLYAAADVEDALSYFDGHSAGCDDAVYRVIGRVSLWGSVVEGARGWRASHAYPQRIYVPARSLDGSSTLTAGEVALTLTDYGVPVELLDGGTKRHVARVLAGLRPAA